MAGPRACGRPLRAAAWCWGAAPVRRGTPTAFRNAPREATGFDGALAAIAGQPWGSALLALVAVGLLAYAAYSLVEARHRSLLR